MLTRIILAYLCAFPVLIGVTANSSGGHILVVSMASTVAGKFQVFFDTGRGFSESESVVLPVAASVEPREYRAPISPGRYRGIRIDPSTLPGRFVIDRAAVLSADGETETTLPLDDLKASYHVTTVERTETHLTVQATPDATDPQILYAPDRPIVVRPEKVVSSATLQRLALASLGGLLVALMLEGGIRLNRDRAAGTLQRIAGVARAHPRLVVVAISLAATMVATYPVLFMSRSMVTPNNGSLPMLYDALPAVPGSTDLEVEDTRFSDVGAMMWAFVPYSNVQREALRDGEWPLWNRYNGAGRPLWGQGQTFLLDPLHWFTLATPDPALGWDLKFVAHRFVFATGIGLAALLATGAWLPAALAAFSAPFVGIYAFRVNHPAMFALTYAPWALLAWLLLARARNRADRGRAALLLAGATSLLLFASPPKEGIAVALAVCGAGGLTVLMAPLGWRDRAASLMTAVMAGGVVLLLTAPHWMIFLDTWKVCATAYDVPYAQVGGLANALALFLGPLAPGPILPGLHLLALVLVVAALTAPRQLFRNRAAFACAIAAAACMTIAFGLVPTGWLLKTPFIGNIGHLHDVFITAAVPVFLIVAASGVSVLRTAGRQRTLAVTALTLLAACWLLSRVAEISPRAGFEPWASLFMLAVAVLLPVCLARARATQPVMVVAAAAAIVVLVLPGGLHARSGLVPLDALLLQPRLRVALDTNSPAVEAMHRAAVEPARGVGVDWALFEGSQALYEIEGIGGPDALNIARFDELLDAATISRSGWMTKVDYADVTRLAPLLDLLNTGYLFSAPEFVPPGYLAMPLTGRDHLKLEHRDTVWPRAFFVDGISRYSDAADLLRQATARRAPFAAVQDGDSRAIVATRGLPAHSGPATPARGYQLSTNTTRFSVDASGPGVVVLGETFLPGEFVATLNGQPVPYFRVNHVFKGIVIPSAGRWDVDYEYRPARWHISLMLGALGAVGLAAVGMVARPGRTRLSERV